MYDELIYKLQELVCDRIKDTDGAMLVCDAINAINALSKPRWIPVTERLPEDRVEVLVSSGMFAPLIEVAFYDGLFYSAWDGETEIAAVTHWMPLPQPSKEEL